MEKVSNAFIRLVKIMDELREQCPWDQKQTIHTLRAMTIEELYELVDAIDSNDWKLEDSNMRGFELSVAFLF